jgi:2-polyprenyl-3-methyl-5-hydroxy-6-metoxy-1,4-benzoquinol methylase
MIYLPGNSNAERIVREDNGSRLERRIIRSYRSLLIRAYCMIRFHIIKLRFLEMIEQHIPTSAKALEIGCGFGLFSLYFSLRQPERHIQGIDLNAKRIGYANEAAQKLNVQNVSFAVGDANTYQFREQFDAVIMLDILHHLPREGAERLIGAVYENLADDGIFLVKDVSTEPAWQMWFTYLMDKLMAPGDTVHYRHVQLWREQILSSGFRSVDTYYLDDYLPYPHVLLVCRK